MHIYVYMRAHPSYMHVYACVCVSRTLGAILDELSFPECPACLWIARNRVRLCTDAVEVAVVIIIVSSFSDQATVKVP